MSNETNVNRSEGNPHNPEQITDIEGLRVTVDAISHRSNELLTKADSRGTSVDRFTRTVGENSGDAEGIQGSLESQIVNAQNNLSKRLKQITTAITFLLAVNSSAFAGEESATQKIEEPTAISSVAGNESTAKELAGTITEAVIGVASEALTRYKADTLARIDKVNSDTLPLTKIEEVRKAIGGVPLVGGKLLGKIESKLPLLSLAHELHLVQDVEKPTGAFVNTGEKQAGAIVLDETNDMTINSEREKSPEVKKIERNFEILVNEKSSPEQKLDAGESLLKSPLAERVLKKVGVLKIFTIFSSAKELYTDIHNPKKTIGDLLKKTGLLLLDAKTFGLVSIAIGMLGDEKKEESSSTTETNTNKE